MSQEKQITVKQVQDLFAKEHLPKPTATTYFPKFRDDVYVINPPGYPPTQVNPTYCLSVSSAMDLMLILENLEPVGYMDPPIIYTGGPFSITSEVPWMTFNNGAVRNAGQLAAYWNNNNGNPGGNTAESRCRQDIAWG